MDKITSPYTVEYLKISDQLKLLGYLYISDAKFIQLSLNRVIA